MGVHRFPVDGLYGPLNRHTNIILCQRLQHSQPILYCHKFYTMHAKDRVRFSLCFRRGKGISHRLLARGVIASARGDLEPANYECVPND